MNGKKMCERCKTEKDLDEFHNCKTNLDGKSNICKVCKGKSNRRYYERHKEESKIRSNKHRHIIPGKANVLQTSAKRRAKRKNIEYSIDTTFIKEKLVKGCALSGIEFKLDNSVSGPLSPTIDRIDSAIGYTKENCRAILYSLNCLKGLVSDKEIIYVLDHLLHPRIEELSEDELIENQKIRNRKCKQMSSVTRGRAKTKELDCDIDTKWVKDNLQDYCPLTGIPFDLKNKFMFWNSPSFDRIDPNIGYLKSNCRIILTCVNAMRGNGNDDLMYEIAEITWNRYVDGVIKI